MFVYTLNDLRTLQDEMEQFWKAALAFNAYLRFKTNKLLAHVLNEYEKVKELPTIKAAIASQKAVRGA